MIETGALQQTMPLCGQAIADSCRCDAVVSIQCIKDVSNPYSIDTYVHNVVICNTKLIRQSVGDTMKGHAILMCICAGLCIDARISMIH